MSEIKYKSVDSYIKNKKQSKFQYQAPSKLIILFRFILIGLFFASVFTNYFVSYENLSFEEMISIRYEDNEGEYIGSHGYYVFCKNDTISEQIYYLDENNEYKALWAFEKRYAYSTSFNNNDELYFFNVYRHDGNNLCIIRAEDNDRNITAYNDTVQFEYLRVYEDDKKTPDTIFFVVYPEGSQSDTIYLELDGDIIWQFDAEHFINR